LAPPVAPPELVPPVAVLPPLRPPDEVAGLVVPAIEPVLPATPLLAVLLEPPLLID
jgi:hypothetical protein